MIANSQFDCGLRSIGHFLGVSIKNKQDSIDRVMEQLVKQNSEVYQVTSIICSLQKEQQKDLWEYLVDKYGFTQITPWHQAKTLIYKDMSSPAKPDEIAIFHKHMFPPKHQVNTL